MRLDIGHLEERPSDELEGFTDRLVAALPGLAEHHCSPGRPGGFVERLRRGTWAAHVVEHVALELQSRAGMDVTYGKTRTTRERGVYTVAYRYVDEDAGLRAGRDAVDVVDAVAAGRAVDVDALVERLRGIRDRNAEGPSTAAILRAARERGLPVIPLDGGRILQIGHGAHAARVSATITSRTRFLGVDVTDDKARTKRVLHDADVPVPLGRVVASLDEAREAAADVGFPVVLKPLVGNHGRGVTTRVADADALQRAFARARRVHERVVVERFVAGEDHRLLVVDHRLVAAARRTPAHVVGDGASTVRELVDAANEDPRRGSGHQDVLTLIHVDDASVDVLREQGLTLADVPAAGERVLLKRTANLSTGGTATDVTDEVHPRVRALAERVSRLLDLDVVGIDVVAPHLRAPLEETGGAIVEVNAAPGLRMHLAPSEGEARDVAAPVLDMLSPARVPVVAITGTNGKTTTACLVRHVLALNGARVGAATTNGVTIGDDVVLEGDYSGPGGARAVLTDPAVDHAVLEVARGGILRRGLGFDACDVGVFLNVGRDHLGDEDVESVDELAHVKGVVVESVREGGTAVLNAEDARVMRFAARTPGRVVLISMDPDTDAFARHVRDGGTGLTVEDGHVAVRRGDDVRVLADVADVPLTMGGRARFNVQNVLAAAAVALALDVPEDVVREGLLTFRPDARELPGRANLVDVGEFRVLVDYGHNVPALDALADLLAELPANRRINVASATGNRDADDIRDFGRAVARLYDLVVVCDPDPRGRPPGETARLVREGLVDGGLAESAIASVPDEADAIATALGLARAGDLVVLQVADVADALAHVDAFRRVVTGATASAAPAEAAQRSGG